MPAILRADGFVVYVFGPPREHPPPHVHVRRRAGGLAVIRLGHRDEPPTVWRVHHLSDREIRRAYDLIAAHQVTLRMAWERIHGTPSDDQ